MDAKWDAMEKKYDSQRYVPKDLAKLGKALGITITNLDDSEDNVPIDAIDFLEIMEETRVPKSQTAHGGKPAVVKVYNPTTGDFTIRGGGALGDDGATAQAATAPTATVQDFSKWTKAKWIVMQLFNKRA